MKSRLIKKLRKSKAFTLIELLAVMLVLGIIALIAVPTVTRIINESKKGIAKVSAENYIRAVEQQVTLSEMSGDIIEPGIYTVSELKALGIDAKGSLPESGTVTIDDSGKVVNMDIILNGFVITYDGTECLVYSEDEIEEEPKFVFKDGTPIYYNPVTGNICSNYVNNNSNTEVTSGCLRWYIFGDTSDNTTLDLLLDHNIIYSVAWGTLDAPTVIMSQLGSLSSWNSKLTRTDKYEFYYNNKKYTANYNGYKARILSLEDVNKILKVDLREYEEDENGDVFNLVDVNTKPRDTIIPASQYGWLFDNTYDCKASGCNTEVGHDEAYWLMDMYDEENPYVMYLNRFSYYYYEDTDAPGVRPVITISKDEALAASYYEDGTPVYYNPVSNSKCTDYVDSNSTGQYNDGCMKWFAYDDVVGTSTVNLLLDHNIANQPQARDLGELEDYDLPILTRNWNITPRLFTLEELLKAIKYNKPFNYNDAEEYNFRYSDYNVNWISPNPTTCSGSGCGESSNGYYLGISEYNSRTSSCGTWTVSDEIIGGDGVCISDGYYGIRPVIFITK